MKPTWNIPEGMVDNADEFRNQFFDRFTLRHADKPVQLTDTISKNYLFPTFYGDVTCAMAICFCSFEKARTLVQQRLGPKVEPVHMMGGRSIVAFSCYEYKKVMNVNPYNEIAVAIPVLVNQAIRPPVLPMIMGFERSGYYIAGMPVTSHENTLRGHNIWSLPKETQEIDIYREGDDCCSVAKEEDGTPYLTVRVPMKGKPAEFDEEGYLYTHHNGRLTRSKTCFKATFNVQKHMGLLFKKGVAPDRPYITIADSPPAAYLRELEIEPHPFQFRYAEHMSSCFDLPDEPMPRWAQNN